jgi:hypothetical protein
MNYLFCLLALIACSNSFSQIWKEPFDTLNYYDKLEKLSGEKLGIISYSVSMFDSDNNPVQFDYYAFDEKGNLVKECQGVSADQKLDTIYYFYNEAGIFQEAVRSGQKRLNIQRNFLFNENGRLSSIQYINGITKTETRYVYNKNELLDSIIYSDSEWTCFSYTKNNMLSKKVIYRNKKQYEYFNYTFPSYQAIKYVNCLMKNDTDVYLPCDETTAYYNEFGKISRIEIKDYSDSSKLHIAESEYDEYGNVVKVFIEEPSGNVETRYIRNEKGLLMRVEHEKDGEVYNYSVFEYEY